MLACYNSFLKVNFDKEDHVNFKYMQFSTCSLTKCALQDGFLEKIVKFAEKYP